MSGRRNPIRLQGEQWHGARWGMRLTCAEHPDFHWVFDGPSYDPEEWDTALSIAYGHFVHAHDFGYRPGGWL